MSNDLARSFLDSLAGYQEDEPGYTPSQDRPVKLGTVDPTYAGAGNPKVLFDGETIMGQRPYPFIGARPAAGARVALLPQGHSYIILGAISNSSGTVGGTRNLLANAAFRINQRAYVSAAALPLNGFGLDRWKATTLNSAMTYGSTPQGGGVTVSSGGSFAQVIERTDIVAGPVTLAWGGTVVGRIYNVGAAAPAYAASPITATLDGLADVVVEFSAAGGVARSLVAPQVTLGGASAIVDRPTYDEDLRRCQRYYYRRTATAGGTRLSSMGIQDNTTSGECGIQVPTPMRAIPTLSFSSLYWTDYTGFNVAVGGLTNYVLGSDTTMVWISATFAASGAGSRVGALSGQAAGSWIGLEAEL